MSQKIHFSPIYAKDAKHVHRLQAKLFSEELTESVEELEEILTNADAVFNCNHSFAIYHDNTMIGYVFAYIDSKSIFYNKDEEVFYIKEFGLLPGYEKYLRLMIFKLTYIWLTFAPRLAMEAHAVEAAKNKWLRLPIIQRQFATILKTRESDLKEKQSHSMTDYFILRWEAGLSGRTPKKYSLPRHGWEYQTGIIVNLISDANRLEALRGEWRKLQEESDASELTSSLDYVLLWWKYFGTWRDLLVIVVRRNDQVIGIAPLMTEYYRDDESLRKKISLIGASVLEKLPQLLFGENERLCIPALLAFLADSDNAWDSLELERQVSPNLATEFDNNIPANRYKLTQHSRKARVLHLDGDYSHFVEKILVNKVAHTKVIDLISGYEFGSYSSAENCKAAIETLSQIEEENENGEGFVNRSPAHYFFYESLVGHLVEERKCRWYVYLKDERVIASQLGFVENERYFSLISTVDLRYPAAIIDVLLLSAAEELMQAGIRSVYLLEGEKNSSALRIKKEVDGVDVRINLKKSIRNKLSSIFSR